MRRSLHALILGVVTVVAASVCGTVPAAAVPVAPPSLVDDGVYPYPDAAQILAEQNVELLSGDGHIVLADCAAPPVGDIGLLKVYTTDEQIGADGIGRVCFSVNASSGVLNLRVPGVYEIRGDGQRTGTGHEVTAELHSDAGDDLTVELDPDGSTPIGLGTDPNASPTMLLQLRAGTGPAPVTGSQPAVGKLASADRMCTAFLVAPRWVLTAKSCFAADPNQPQVAEGAPSGTHYVLFPGKAPVTVDYVTPRTDRDVTLARLSTAVTGITPLSTSDAGPPPGVGVAAYGYGRTSTWITDQLQTTSIVFASTGAATIEAPSADPVCSGTAGGPVLSNGSVVGILSRAGQAGCLGVAGTDSSVSAARADGLRSWIAAITTTNAVHTWALADMPPGATTVTTTADNLSTAPALPLTGTAGTTWATGDTYSPAVVFNGTSGQLTTTAPPVDTTADFTISAWVKPSVANGTVLSLDGTQTAAFKLYIDSATQSWRFAMSNADSTSATWATAAAPDNSVALNQWAQITIAFKNSSRLMTLDINGVNRATIGHGTIWKGTGGLRIGALKTGASTVGNWFAGRMAFVQSWNEQKAAFRSYAAAGSTVANTRAGTTEVYFNSSGTLKETHFNGTAWSAPASLGATGVQGIPTAIQNPVTNNVEVYYAAGGNLWQKVFDGTTWTTTNFGVAASGQPAVLVNPDTNGVEVYFNSANTLKERHWTSAAGWSAVTAMGAAITGSPAVVFNPFNHNIEIYLNSGGVLQEKYYSGGVWSALKNLTTPMTGQPAAVYNPNLNNMQIYFNSGGTLKERFWNPFTGWSGTAGGSLGVTSMTGSPAAVYNPTLGNIQVYANSAGALKEKFWSVTTGAWSNVNDLQSPITNSPWVIPNGVTGNVEVYLNSGGNLTLKSWSPTASWAPLLNLGGPLTN